MKTKRMMSRPSAAMCCWLIMMMMMIVASAAAEKQSVISPIEFFQRLLGSRSDDAGGAAGPPQPMIVIGAGLARTATASYTLAMRRLGLKTYHMKEGVLETPGHLDLWYHHAKAQHLNGENGADTLNAIIDGIASQGFNTSQDIPSCLIYKELMDRYPNARVVMTVRSDGNGQAWAKSMLSSVLLMHKVTRQIPFIWIPRVQRMHVFMDWLEWTMQVSNDPATNLPNRDELAAFYERWVKTVQETVPEDRLLVFAAKEGWKPLCDFVSPLDASIAATCDEILASGEAYPYANESAMVQKVVAFLSLVNYATNFVLVVIPCGLLYYLFGRSGGGASKQKSS